MKKVTSLCILCILIIALSGCKSKQDAGDGIENPFLNIDSSEIVSVEFYNQKDGYDMCERFESKKAVEQTLAYLKTFPILTENIKSNENFVIGSTDRYIRFYDKNGDVLVNIAYLLYNLDSDDFETQVAWFSLYDGTKVVEYHVPSDYVKPIGEYMREVAVENIKERSVSNS